MLTEHEQLADHEARISRQELPPLQQPLDNIEEIRQALNNEWLPWEIAPDVVDLLWFIPRYREYKVEKKAFLHITTSKTQECVWQSLPPQPKDENV